MRKSQIELLRIISMLMIVCLHYLSKGGALVEPVNAFTINGYVAWLFEAFCLVGVNVFFFISGYFSSEKSTTVDKIAKLWLQIWFYSVVIGLIFLVIGQQNFDIYVIYQYLFPIVTEHYWFGTAFVLLSFLAPFLQRGASRLDDKALRKLIFGLLLFTSLAKSVIPMQLPWDKQGYDVIWAVVPYLTGLYLRKYGLPKLVQKKSRALLTYIICELGIFVWMLLLQQVYLRTGKIPEFIDYAYSYNFILCYLGSLGFFAWFLQKKEISGKAGEVICKLSKATFGVYLIHEHVNMRYLWPTWFHCEETASYSLPLWILHLIVTMIIVYIVCTVLELCRQTLFRKVSKVFFK